MYTVQVHGCHCVIRLLILTGRTTKWRNNIVRALWQQYQVAKTLQNGWRKLGDKWYNHLAGCTVGYSYPPPSNNNRLWYNNQSNFKPALCCLSYTIPYVPGVCTNSIHTKHITHTHPKTQSATEKGTKTKSQITQDPSSKKTLVPDSRVSSVSALCQTKALNESGWESQDPTALTCSQSSYLTQRQAFFANRTPLPQTAETLSAPFNDLKT